MSQEAILLECDGHATTTGQAAVVARHSTAQRIALATLWVGAGLLLAAPCILIPVVHLVSTWALPLLGILLAVRTWKRRIIIYQPIGVCPACCEPIELTDGSIDDPSWQTCPKCHAKLKVRLP